MKNLAPPRVKKPLSSFSHNIPSQTTSQLFGYPAASLVSFLPYLLQRKTERWTRARRTGNLRDRNFVIANRDFAG